MSDSSNSRGPRGRGPRREGGRSGRRDSGPRRGGRDSGGRSGGGRAPSSGGHGKGLVTSGEPEAVPTNLPKTAFEAFDMSPWLVQAIAAAGFVNPSPIQARMIPLVLEEKNVMGRSRTGTGKTAAFLIPLIALLEEVEDPDAIREGMPRGPVRVLIVVPTRELAIQVAEEAEKLTRFVPVRTVCAYGGTRLDAQARALRDAAIVVGTPGRLLDLIGRGYLDLSSLDAMVLDEVDRMYDLGFREDVDKLLMAGKARQQTVLTSATLNDDVEDLIAKHVGDHERILIESRSLTVDEVDQHFYYVDPRRKQDLLLEVARELNPTRGIVFVRTRFSVDRVTYQLQQRGINAELIHSGLAQRQRERILERFKNGEFPLLIATDVASRGLDIEGITHVINFDLPQTPEDYVHRVGRTARFGARGTAVSFVTQDDGPLLTAIEKLINKEIRQESFPGFEAAPPVATGPTEAAAPKAADRPVGLPPWANVKRRRR